MDKFEELKIIITDQIQVIIEQLPQELKSIMAEFIAVQATIYGGNTTYEGIGILDVAKRTYENLCEEVYQQDIETETDKEVSVLNFKPNKDIN